MSPKKRKATTRHAPLVPERVDTEVLNAEGAARLLGVSVRLVLRLARADELPGMKVGKEWRFSRTSLLRWLGSAGYVPKWVKYLEESRKTAPEKKPRR